MVMEETPQKTRKTWKYGKLEEGGTYATVTPKRGTMI
jgi:hypothetical protein